MPHINSIFLNLLTLFVALFIALLIGEMALQIFYRLQNGHWIWENSAFHIGYTQPVDDRRQYSLRPNYNNQKAGITINKMGFREPVPIFEKDNPIIVCVGDSVPFGAGVKDNETYSAYLAQLIKKNQMSVDVLNAGVPSYNLRQSFDRLRIEVTPYIPYSKIAAITIEAANDISLLTQYGSDWNPDLTWAQVRWSQSWRSKWPPWKKVTIFYYLSNAIGFVGRNRPVDNVPSEVRIFGYNTAAMLDNTKKVLRQELAFYRTHSISIILMPVNPFYYQLSNQKKNSQLKYWNRYVPYIEDWNKLILQYNNTLRQVSQEFENTYFFEMRSLMDAQDRNIMYKDFIHYSPAGNEIWATAIFDFLLQKQFLPNK